tara:strand:- start:2638 stop:3357 length:720 start_codon:yes stop_codon:yes gene_type:complete
MNCAECELLNSIAKVRKEFKSDEEYSSSEEEYKSDGEETIPKHIAEREVALLMNVIKNMEYEIDEVRRIKDELFDDVGSLEYSNKKLKKELEELTSMYEECHKSDCEGSDRLVIREKEIKELKAEIGDENNMVFPSLKQKLKLARGEISLFKTDRDNWKVECMELKVEIKEFKEASRNEIQGYKLALFLAEEVPISEIMCDDEEEEVLEIEGVEDLHFDTMEDYNKYMDNLKDSNSSDE